MENISKALDSIQEQLLTLYEKDSADLTDQIEHWHLNRREQTLYHYARRQGWMRIGMNPVPSLAASQSKAKSAIEQELLLQSMQKSAFAREPWTLSDTSRERLLTEPAYCFKKGGRQVEVRYDNDRDNTSRHVLWDFIYFQGDNDEWHKTPGRLDARGLYYMDGKVKTYYVDFEEEAKKYGKTGTYEILNKLTTPVPTSTSSPTGPRDSPGSGSAASTGVTPKKQTPGKRRGPLRFTSPKGPRPGGFRRGRGRGQGELPAPAPGTITPPSAEEVGKASATVPRGSTTRLGRLLLDARDPPLLVLKGDPNSLKCVRYRLKGKYPSLFCWVSTTWSWTASTGTARWGGARMILTFKDLEQREVFVKTVKLPKSVQFFRGSFDDY
nr:E2 [Felis domesticus papillomavirus 1]